MSAPPAPGGPQVKDVFDGLVNEGDDVRVDHPVEDVSPVAARVDPPGQTQLGKVLADAGLGSPHSGDQRRDVDFVVGQNPQEVQPARGAEEPEELD
jgi:hypothetical protein